MPRTNQVKPRKLEKKTKENQDVPVVTLRENFSFKDIFDVIIANPVSAFSKITGSFSLKGFENALKTDPEWALVINFLEANWKYGATKDLLKANIGVLKSIDKLPYDARLLALAEVQKLHCDTKTMKQFSPTTADLSAMSEAICIPIDEVKKIDNPALFSCLPTIRKEKIIKEGDLFDIYDSKSTQFAIISSKNDEVKLETNMQNEADINAVFNKLTCGIFENTQDWPLDNMVFAGNFVRSLILGKIPSVESDVDIFIKGKNADECQKTFNRIITAFKARGARFARYGMSVVNVFMKGYPHTFQIIHTSNSSGLSVVQGFDMSHVGCFIQKSKVYVTPLFLITNYCGSTFVLPGYNEILPLRIMKALKTGLSISICKQNKFLVSYLDDRSKLYDYLAQKFEKLAVATSEPKWEILKKIEEEKSFDVLAPKLYSNMMHTSDSDLIIKTTVQANSIKHGYSQSLFLADCDVTHISKYPLSKDIKGYKYINSVLGKNFVFTVISKIVVDKDKISFDLSEAESVALTSVAKHLTNTAKIGKIREQSHLYDKQILQASLIISPADMDSQTTLFLNSDHKTSTIDPASDIKADEYYRIIVGLRVQTGAEALYLEPCVRMIAKLNEDKQREIAVAAPVKAVGRRVVIN